MRHGCLHQDCIFNGPHRTFVMFSTEQITSFTFSVCIEKDPFSALKRINARHIHLHFQYSKIFKCLLK